VLVIREFGADRDWYCCRMPFVSELRAVCVRRNAEQEIAKCSTSSGILYRGQSEQRCKRDDEYVFKVEMNHCFVSEEALSRGRGHEQQAYRLKFVVLWRG
jgi:hypothetical protein